MRNRVICILLCVLAMVLSCRKDEEETSPPNEQAGSEETSAQVSENDSHKITMKKTVPEDDDGEAESRQVPVDETGKVQREDMRGKIFFLYSSREDAAVPDHAAIGPLASPYAGGEEEKEAYRLVDDFLAELKNGEIKKSVIEDADSEVLITLLEEAVLKQQFPKDWYWYVGKFRRMDNGEGGMPLILRGGKHTTQGAVYIVKSDGKWYIDDIQVDFSVLRENK